MVSALAVSASDIPQLRYIERYASTAVREMYRSGVPASITLAQGLLESRYGQSPLAAEGNNHFGIKCYDWKGRTMKVDDDRKDECFRVYGCADESFRDHSDFLRYRQRYQFLFDYDITDYKAWANGLKKAGYATDPQYPAKLIKLIEDYDLSKYDRMKPADFGTCAEQARETAGYDVDEQFGRAETVAADDGVREQRLPSSSKKQKKVRVKKVRHHSTPEREVVPEVIPESPSVLEEPEMFRSKAGETLEFSLERPVYSNNGVPFIYSEEGDTYQSIAENNNLFIREILRYNDLEIARPLAPGTVVYLQAKKNQSRKGLDKHIVDEDGEMLRDICQKYAVKESAVMKLNSFGEGHVLKAGDTVLLRK